VSATLISALLISTALPPFISFAWGRVQRKRGRVWNFYGGWVSSCIGGAVGWALSGSWNLVAVDAANALLAVIMWWLSRRRKRRAPKSAGAKSKAILAAVVARMRETLKPRPVLRPVPGGAR
jgi:hypothetical protein